LNIIRPEQVWVSDITYIKLIHDWAYLSLVTDAFSKKIMGFSLRMDLTVASACCFVASARYSVSSNIPLRPHDYFSSIICVI
ncbi:MAG TPA: DDE-type integrase/transposase/recombinase, partial [Saprospiraceae bacterium]|nr:DDE-type integrase/transposase/recombinase [Saprospiraceae bacterium]